MERLFLNMNGSEYAIVEGGEGKRTLLVNMHSNQCVVCAVLEKNSWWQGSYFEDFEEAYNYFKNF